MASFRSSLKLNQHTSIGKEELKKLNQMLSQLIANNDSFEFRTAVDWKGLGLMDYPNVVKYPMDLGTVKDKVRNSEYVHVEECLDDIQLVWDNCKNYNAEGSWIYKLSEKLEKHFKNMIKNYLPAIQFMQGVVNINNQPIEKEKLSMMKKDNDKDNENSNSMNGSQNEQNVSYNNNSTNNNNNNNNNQNNGAGAGAGSNTQNQINQDDDDESDTITTQDKVIFSQRIKMLPTEQLGMIVYIIKQSATQAFKDLDKDKCQILVDQIDPETFKKINQQIDLWNITTETISKKVKI